MFPNGGRAGRVAVHGVAYTWLWVEAKVGHTDYFADTFALPLATTNSAPNLRCARPIFICVHPSILAVDVVLVASCG
jgi:hypothetical protein